MSQAEVWRSQRSESMNLAKLVKSFCNVDPVPFKHNFVSLVDSQIPVRPDWPKLSSYPPFWLMYVNEFPYRILIKLYSNNCIKHFSLLRFNWIWKRTDTNLGMFIHSACLSPRGMYVALLAFIMSVSFGLTETTAPAQMHANRGTDFLLIFKWSV